ncbi:MAG: sigma factor, partial [Acetanaerobacterium sp.]
MTIHLHGVYADLNITENTPDEVLVTAARVGCDDSLTVLIARFLPVISRRAMDSEHSFLEKDDLIQEGMIALLRAIRFYQADRNATFATFATACINNSIRSALKATRRFKHMPLNNYVSLSEERAEDHIAQQLCANYTSSPETLV